MKYLATLILSLATGSVLAQPFANGDAAAGKKLFDDNKCNSCHIDMVGGDGSAHLHPPQPQRDQARRNVGAMNVLQRRGRHQPDGAERRGHLAAYLNQTYYKFK